MINGGNRMLPKGWNWVKLGRMGKLTQGGTPSTDVAEFWNGKIPFITGADVTNLFVANARSYLTERGIDSGKTKKCEKGDLLIVSRTRVGRIGIAATTLGISQDVSAIKLKERYHDKYIAIYLSSLPKYLQESSQGAIIKGLTRDFLENLEIPVPPTIDDQLTIANKLEKKAINILEMRQAALRQKEAAEALPGAILRELFSFKDGERLPQGWNWAKIKDICTVNPNRPKGFKRSANAKTSFVPMDAIDESSGIISKRLVREYETISTGYTYFEEGDVLFAKITPCMQNGKSAMVDSLIDGIGFGSTEFHVLRPKAEVTKEWIYNFIRTSDFRNKAEANFDGSAGQQRVPKSFLENAFIPLPSNIDEQSRITENLSTKMREAEKMREAANRQLSAIEAMPAAMLREVFDFDAETGAAD